MRRPRPRRLPTLWTVLALGLAALGSTAVSSLAAPTSVAGADPIADCSTTTGVIVVVDFATSVYGDWPGTIERGCDGSLTTGAYALTRAGFTPPEGAPIGVAGESGFVCRLVDPANHQEYPTTAEQDCLETPPANAYWSFWYAQAGDTSWTYSNQGAADFEPAAGSVDAWVFGGQSAGGQPPIPSPTSLRATNQGPPVTAPVAAPPATNSPSTPVTAAGSPPPGAGGGTTSGTTQPGRTGAGHSTPTSVAPGSTRSPDGTTPEAGPVSRDSQSPSTGTGTGTGGPSSSGPRILNVTPSSAVAKTSAGSPLPFVLGAVVVAGLAGAAGVVAWRRRETD